MSDGLTARSARFLHPSRNFDRKRRWSGAILLRKALVLLLRTCPACRSTTSRRGTATLQGTTAGSNATSYDR